MSTALQTFVASPGTCCSPITGSSLGDAEAVALADTYAALADPVRLKLLSLIAASGEMCSCDLVEPLAKSQPTVSHHTKILAEAGLIAGDKRGRWVYWGVPPARAEFVRRVLGT
jgi:ArsR family transcriptional regulator